MYGVEPALGPEADKKRGEEEAELDMGQRASGPPVQGTPQLRGGAPWERRQRRACASARGLGKGRSHHKPWLRMALGGLRSEGWGPLGIGVRGREREGPL